MSARPRLSVALSHYDRFVPFYDGTLRTPAFDLDVLHVSQSNEGRYGNRRHERMIQDGEFDVAELSLSSYLMARTRRLPFVAIPIFPRRLFSQSQMWVRSGGDIREPRDLIGRAVGLSTFQTTLSVLAKGDLQAEYGVPWRSIEWVVSKDETVPFSPEPGVVIRKAPKGTTIDTLLLEGEIAAIFQPHPPKVALGGSTAVQRLFPNPRAEEARYFHKIGFYPIMHLIVLRAEIDQRFPEAARVLYELFTEAGRAAERYYDDPNWSRLAWARLLLEEERQLLGPDIWPSGVAKNHDNLERFIGYSHDQGLIDRPLDVEDLFVPDLVET